MILLKAHPATQAASRAATPADLNDGDVRRNPGEPSREQAEAGRYNKPRVAWRGLMIAVENPAGSVRRGKGWEARMKFDYGEIMRTEGVDGDPVDVILGPNMDAPMVYVVHQRRYGDWENYDEDKCCIGFDSEDEARAAFLSNYTDPRFLGPVTAMPADEFVAKVKATRKEPAMIKSDFGHLVLFLKARTAGDTRTGDMFGTHVETRTRKDGVVQKYHVGSAAPSTAVAPRQRLFIQRGSQRHEIGSLSEASKKWSQFRDATGVGVSELGNGATIVDQHGAEVARISYNGRVWPPGEWHSGMKPLIEAGETEKDAALDAAIDHLKEDAGQRELPAAEKKEDAALVAKLEEARGDDPEADLRAMWTEQGVSKERQDELIRQIADKAKPGAQVGPFTVGANDGPDPNEVLPAGHSRKFYVTMRRDGEKRTGWLAGPFDRHEDALAHVDRAREAAYEADPRSHFDAFGTASYVAEDGKHHPGVLNERLGVGALDLSAGWAAMSEQQRRTAIAGASHKMSDMRGNPTVKAKRIAAGDWSNVPEDLRDVVARDVRLHMKMKDRKFSAKKTEAPASIPAAVAARAEPEKPSEHASEQIIGGVKFSAVRKLAPTPHWRAVIDENGQEIEAYSASTRGELWDRLKRDFRAIGADRWRWSIGIAPQVTETPEFKRWFGDSKIFDGDGKPMVLYHATASDFDTFKPGGDNPNLSGPAIWLTANRENPPAAHNIRQVPGKPGFMYGNQSGKYTPGSNVMPLYVRMEKPFYVDAEGLRQVIEQNGLNSSFPFLIERADVVKLKGKGYDGVIMQGGMSGDEYVVFDPTQVKSATGNRGTFDANNPDMTKSILLIRRPVA